MSDVMTPKPTMSLRELADEIASCIESGAVIIPVWHRLRGLPDELRAISALSTPPAEGDDTKRMDWLLTKVSVGDMRVGSVSMPLGNSTATPASQSRAAIDAAMIAATEGSTTPQPPTGEQTSC